MQFVLIKWLIKIGSANDFKDYWRSKVPVDDRSKLIGEFLSLVED